MPLVGLSFEGNIESKLEVISKDRDKFAQFLKKSSSRTLDYEFLLMKLISILEIQKKKVRVFIGTDYEQIKKSCLELGLEGYAILLDNDEKTTYCCIVPRAQDLNLEFSLLNLSQTNPTRIRDRDKKIHTNIPRTGVILVDGDIVYYGKNKQFQFFYNTGPEDETGRTIIYTPGKTD